jgi:hypothetical protein
MQIPHAVRIFAFLASTAVFCAAQGASATPPGQSQPVAPVVATSLVQPSLDGATNTLNALKLEKWKKGSVRDEAEQNVNSMLHDVQTNVPPLMAAADATPGSLSAAMPLVKHLDALYDVLLRVEEAARVAAPGEQVDALQQALAAFGAARFALDDELQKQAVAQEKQLSDMRVAVAKSAEAQRAAEARVAAQKPCPAPSAKPVQRKKHTTAAKKPQSAPSQKTQPPVAQKPQ